jgi:competence protein ComEC
VVWLDLLDVGQGLAAIVRTEHHALVYDTGPKSRSGFDTGKTVVVPFLVHEGMHQIDTLVISHSDNDHHGGAESLFSMIEVDSILSGMPQSINFARARRCVRGQHWDWDGVLFEVLSPLNQISGNNSSCVLRITAKNGQRLLLTGDIEAEIEQQLVNDFGKALQAEIIVAPHHGSRTSSTVPFIGLVDPNIVLFPAGYRNRFGFPKSDIAARYRRLGTESLVTGRDGAIRVVLGRPGEPPLITAFRQYRRRYWRNLSAD